MKRQKPTTGRLLFCPAGGPEQVLAKGLPFPQLQELKKQYIANGTAKIRLKITY